MPATESHPDCRASSILIVARHYLAKQRWLIERDYRELKQELGLGHYEGRGWPGFHHHAALAVAAYGFLVSKRLAIPPSAAHKRRLLEEPALPKGFRSRGAADPTRASPAGLHCHRAQMDRGGPGKKAATMSLLSAEHTGAAQPASRSRFATGAGDG